MHAHGKRGRARVTLDLDKSAATLWRDLGRGPGRRVGSRGRCGPLAVLGWSWRDALAGAGGVGDTGPSHGAKWWGAIERGPSRGQEGQCTEKVSHGELDGMRQGS